jgi:hypothetical protein
MTCGVTLSAEIARFDVDDDCAKEFGYSGDSRNRMRGPVAFFGRTSCKGPIFDRTDCSEWSAVFCGLHPRLYDGAAFAAGKWRMRRGAQGWRRVPGVHTPGFMMAPRSRLAKLGLWGGFESSARLLSDHHPP